MQTCVGKSLRIPGIFVDGVEGEKCYAGTGVLLRLGAATPLGSLSCCSGVLSLPAESCGGPRAHVGLGFHLTMHICGIWGEAFTCTEPELCCLAKPSENSLPLHAHL